MSEKRKNEMNVSYYLPQCVDEYGFYTFSHAPLVISLEDRIYVAIINNNKRLTKAIISYIIKRPELYFVLLPENFLDLTTFIKGKLVGVVEDIDFDIKEIHDIVVDKLYEPIDKALFADVYNGVRKISFCE